MEEVKEGEVERGRANKWKRGERGNEEEREEEEKARWHAKFWPTTNLVTRRRLNFYD